METQKQASTLTTAVVTGAAVIPAAMAVEWAKAKGLVLTPETTQALATVVTVSIGAAANWVVAIIESFVAAVVALNNAVAARAAKIINSIGGTQ